MSHIDEVLASHRQLYSNSCAASGMELLLKLHSLVTKEFRGIQDEYKGQNIGFEKLDELKQYGIDASDQRTSIEDAVEQIEAEVQSSRYPLVSLFDQLQFHIWVAISGGDGFVLRSRSYNNEAIARIDDVEELVTKSKQYQSGTLHFVTYELVDMT
jgi:hypothetical protein